MHILNIHILPLIPFPFFSLTLIHRGQDHIIIVYNKLVFPLFRKSSSGTLLLKPQEVTCDPLSFF